MFGGVLTHACVAPAALAGRTPVPCPPVLRCASAVEACVRVSSRGYGDRRDEVGLYGFDNIGAAFMTQFMVSTLDEWRVNCMPRCRPRRFRFRECTKT